MEIELGKLLLDMVKVLRDVFATERQLRNDLVAKGGFLELYGSATRLQGRAQKIVKLQKDKTVIDEQALKKALHLFFEDLRDFERTLRRANRMAIEIYHPDLALSLVRAWDSDKLAFNSVKAISRLKNIGHRSLARLLELHTQIESPRYRMLFDRPRATSMKEAFEAVAADISSLQQVLSGVIQTSWDFEDVATLPDKHT